MLLYSIGPLQFNNCVIKCIVVLGAVGIRLKKNPLLSCHNYIIHLENELVIDEQLTRVFRESDSTFIQT